MTRTIQTVSCSLCEKKEDSVCHKNANKKDSVIKLASLNNVEVSI